MKHNIIIVAVMIMAAAAFSGCIIKIDAPYPEDITIVVETPEPTSTPKPTPAADDDRRPMGTVCIEHDLYQLYNDGTTGSLLRRNHPDCVPPAVATATKAPVPEPTPTATVGLNPPRPIYIQANALTPRYPTIRVGESLYWINIQEPEGRVSLISEEGLWEHQPIDTDEKFQYTFTTPGRYSYACYYHDMTMHGTVYVEPNDTEGIGEAEATATATSEPTSQPTPHHVNMPVSILFDDAEIYGITLDTDQTGWGVNHQGFVFDLWWTCKSCGTGGCVYEIGEDEDGTILELLSNNNAVLYAGYDHVMGQWFCGGMAIPTPELTLPDFDLPVEATFDIEDKDTPGRMCNLVFQMRNGGYVYMTSSCNSERATGTWKRTFEGDSRHTYRITAMGDTATLHLLCNRDAEFVYPGGFDCGRWEPVD